jgi:hypothetical protein
MVDVVTAKRLRSNPRRLGYTVVGEELAKVGAPAEIGTDCVGVRARVGRLTS